MEIRNFTLIHSVLIFLFINCVNTRRKKFLQKSDFDSDSAILLNSMQLIRRFNYPAETHLVSTSDGYLLNLFRIPKNGPPVLLVHGIGDSSDSWLVLGPKNSLAYQLSDAGFDVWVHNSRGNKYSKGHVQRLSKKRYWDFSFEELGTQDLPATIDHILSVTSQDKISYVGFSQGTTIFFVMCSLKPEYNKKIHHASLLAPVAWVTRLQYPGIDLFSRNLRLLSDLMHDLKLYELFPDNIVANLYHSKVCNETSPVRVLCELEFYISYGIKNVSNLSLDDLPVISSHIPAGTSTKNFLHFIQGYRSKSFQRYDYGPSKNKVIYGTREPPSYDVSLVSAPVSLFYSESDWFSTSTDVDILKSKLPNVVNSVVLRKALDFTHLEFVYGSRVKTLINEAVISLAIQYCC